MGNCKDCKWWDKDEGRYKSDYGRCTLIPDWDEPGEDTLAVVSNTYDDVGHFDTKAEYGCVLFEAKKQAGQ